MNERWKPIQGAPEYEVSDLGRVRSLVNRYRTIPPPRILKLSETPGTGYLSVSIKMDGRWVRSLVHRLVLEAFVGPCPDGMEACHGPDHDRSNCRLDNLRWDTRSANAKDRVKAGTCHMLKWTETHPEWMRRGDAHWTRLKPQRVARGENHGESKLTAPVVSLMRWLRRDHSLTSGDANLWFGISRTTAKRIFSGKSWSHVS